LANGASISIATPPPPPETTINDITVSIEIEHTNIGDLTLTLQAPDGTLLPLMARPGRGESGTGNDDDLIAANGSINWNDSFTTSGEDMGDATASVVGDDGVFDFAPSADFLTITDAIGPIVSSFSELIASSDLSGIWKIYANDSNAGGTGDLISGTITISFLERAGRYFGDGVTYDSDEGDYDFDPVAAGVGVHTIGYIYSDENGCFASAEDDIEVFAVPTVSLVLSGSGTCLNAGVQSGLGGGTPSGGVYSGDGVTDDGNGMTYSFDPAAAGVGVHTITYTFTDGNNCTNTATADFEVLALPNVSFNIFAIDQTVCSDQPEYTILPDVSPTGGVFSGAGVTDFGDGELFDFDPAVAGVGVHIITYTVTGSNGCTNTANAEITVLQAPTVTFTAPDDLCENAGVLTGLSGSPTNAQGLYEGPGVTDDGNGMTYSFDPATAGVGVHTLMYTFEDPNGCRVTVSDDVEVFTAPTVYVSVPEQICVDADPLLNLGDICGASDSSLGLDVPDDTYDDQVVTLANMTTFTTQVSGIPSGVTIEDITASVGITHTYTGDVTLLLQAPDGTILPLISRPRFPGLIAGSATRIDVNAPGSMPLRWNDNFPDDLEDVVNIGGNDLVGVETGGFEYFPNGDGVTITDAPGSVVDDFADLFAQGDGLNGIWTLYFGDAEEQDLGTIFSLQICVDVAPDGGTFSGLGVTDNGDGTYDFDPATAGVGTHTITYEFTGTNGCTGSASDVIEVLDLPTVTFTAPADLCVNAGVQSGLGGGMPTGGIYSGPGVTDDGNGITYSFDPVAAGAGNRTITYTYTDGNGCSNAASDQVLVYSLPTVTFTALADLCENDGVQMNLGGGSPLGGVYSGPGVTDNGDDTYNFDPVAAGVGIHTITYNFTDANGCSASASDMVEVLAVPMIFLSVPEEVCENEDPLTDLGDLCGITTNTAGVSVPDDTYDNQVVTLVNMTTFSTNVSGLPAGVTVYDITASIGLTHTYTGDITLLLQAPDGTILPLISRPRFPELLAGSGTQIDVNAPGSMPLSWNDNFPDDLEDVVNIGGNDLVGVETGGFEYFPNGDGVTITDAPGAVVDDFADLFAQSDGLNGTWTLYVADAEAEDVGTIFSLEICVDTTPNGGVYSGPGVMDDGNGTTFTFDPATAGVGTHTVTYEVVVANGCTATATDEIEVIAAPVVTFNAPADLCVDAGVQAGLDGGTPTGGVYSGTGVTDDGNGMTYSFDPTAAGIGVHTITYDFTDSNGCSGSASDDVEVFSIPSTPDVTFPQSVCVDAGVQTLGPLCVPCNGAVYSGTGVTDNGNGDDFQFDPSVNGVGIVPVTVTLTNANGCIRTLDVNVTVLALPTVAFTAPADLCVDAGVLTGLGGGSPPEGTANGDMGVYSGTGVTDDGNGQTYSFDPAAAGVGVHTLTYTYTDEDGCSNSDSDDIEVFALPNVTFTALADLCVDAGVITNIGGGVPLGGAYSGTGVTDDGNGMTYSFDPMAAGVGVHTITYDFTDANGCSGNASDDVEVFDLPTVTFDNATDFLCLDAPVQNVALGGGAPAGGVYSGPGVTDAGNGTEFFFDPVTAGIARHDITYTFTDANGCTNTATTFIDVNSCEVEIFDPCACLDNATVIDVDAGTGGDDGQFAEVVRISGMNGGGLNNGQIWSVVGGSGGVDAFFANTQGMQTPGTPIPTDGSVTLIFFNEGYNLNFYHYDEAGYDVVIEGPYAAGDPRNQTLSIANLCQYPNPIFDPALPTEEICQTDPAITLGGTDTNGNGANSVTFTINGNAATEFDPAALGNGTYTVLMTFSGQPDANAGISPDGGTTPSAPGCVQTVQQVVMVGNAPPIITCPADDFGLPAGCNPLVPTAATTFNVAGAANPDPALPTVDEGCGLVTITSNDVISDDGCTRTVIRTYRATDQNGDFDECEQTFTFTFDPDSPTFNEILPGDITVQCDAVPMAVTLTASDNCTPEIMVSFNEVRTNGACPQTYTLTRTWTTEDDDCGNPGITHVQIVNVEDTTSPTFDQALPGDITVECDAVPTEETLTASDNCDPEVPVSFNETRTDGPCPQTYILTRVWSAMDDCGNPVSHTQIVNVEDTTAPTFNEALPADMTVECDAVPMEETLTASDNCDSDVPVSFNETRTDGPCPHTYTLTRVWSATDDCGNPVSHTQVVTVEDTTPPSFNEALPMNMTVECDAVPTAAVLTAMDNCDPEVPVSFNEVRTDTDCPQEYLLTRTWSAQDDCGNPVSHTQRITVEDTTAPTPVCNTIRIFLNEAGMYTLTQADIDAIAAGASDNCDADFTYSIDQTMFNCDDIDLTIGAIGGAEVQMTFEDCAGNRTTCTAIVEIDDSAVPFNFGCVADVNVTLGDNCAATLTPDMVVTGFDDCIDSYNIMVDGMDTDQVVGCGDHTYMIELVEDGEVVYTCWGNLFAEDKTDPVVECPDDIDEITVEFDLQT
ncbi:MAG: proprotein convertase P-domain-containing protein, partial [Bacteroidota bacterium]